MLPSREPLHQENYLNTPKFSHQLRHHGTKLYTTRITQILITHYHSHYL